MSGHMIDSSPPNQGHLRWGGNAQFSAHTHTHVRVHAHLPPPPHPTPPSSRCLFDQVLSGRFDQQLIASDWPRCDETRIERQSVDGGLRGTHPTPPSRRARV